MRDAFHRVVLTLEDEDGSRQSRTVTLSADDFRIIWEAATSTPWPSLWDDVERIYAEVFDD